MNKIQKGLILNKDEYYVKHLSIINPVLPVQLTNKEILVLASFMCLPPSITEDDRFNSLARKKVMEKLNLSPGGLGNYLKSMIEKGFLRKSDITKRISINEVLVPEQNKQGYIFKIELKKEEDGQRQITE